MMNGSDLYELAKILDHSNFKLTERYVRLAPKQIAQNQKHCAGECGPTLRANFKKRCTRIVRARNFYTIFE
jgi:hypothetical protein